MQKTYKRLLLIIISVLVLTGCAEEEKLERTYSFIRDDNLNSYKIEAVLDEKEKTLEANQIFSYRNDTGQVLDELYFHIYPNAFKDLDRAPILFAQDIKKKDYDIGYMDIKVIKSNDIALDYEILGQDETILKIDLNQTLPMDGHIDIYMEYKLKYPSSKDRFGYGDRVINSGNWYPILCVYDEDGWNTEPYYKLGDPFYSHTANYLVNITTSKDTILASSGNISKEETSWNKKTYTIEGNSIRDFAWVASKDFKIISQQLGHTEVLLYYLDDNITLANTSLEIGAESLKVFNNIFGPYPYDRYSIVMTEFPSGMEYPTIVFISNDIFLYGQVESMERVIVHETAHQWWYGLVGSDQVKEAWLDEGLTTYSEAIYMKERYGEEIGEKYFEKLIESGYDYGLSFIKNSSVNRHLKDFNGWDDYGILAYNKAAMFFKAIEDEFGQEVLYDILKEYFSEYSYKNARAIDFIEICEEVTGSDLGHLLDQWIY